MSTFVLIHGGWHAAWCWLKVIPLLESHGHRVIAPDLPAHGADLTPLAAKPYEMYVPSVCALLDTVQEPAIMVGHSSGGMIITEASSHSGDRIKGLVYLSAFLLAPGKTPRDVMGMDNQSLLPGSLEIDSINRVSIVKKECAKSVFYGDCSEEDAAWAISRLQPEPLIPPGSVVAETALPKLTGPIRRFYIECLQDKALSPHVQRFMYTDSVCDGVYSLPTSHSPFISAPEALTRHLLAIDERL